MDTDASSAPVHVERIAIRWRDMDALGHVNNTVYFGYIEEARNKWLEPLRPVYQEAGTDTVVASAKCDYRRPMAYPGAVEVRVFVNRVGNSSLTTRYELRLAGSDVLHADGEAVLVWVDLRSGQPARVPDVVRARLSTHQGD